MQNNVLEMKGISKQFPGVKALDNVDFSVARGEIHALVGENGAGKSTLIKILGGVYSPDAGEILLDGEKVSYASPQAAMSIGISIVHQELNLVPYMSVAENLFMGKEPPRTRLGLIDWKELYRKAQEMLAIVNLQDLVQESVGELSVAQRQLLQIGRGVSFGAKIIVFDEPTACLSRNEVDDLFAVIRLLRDRGTSIIYVSHRLEEVFELADRVSVLKDGKMVGVVKTEEATTQQIINMMLGREMVSERRRISYASSEVVLQVEHLSSNTGIRDVSFEVRAGEVLGLAGVVGSGRTELARLLFGVDRATKGRIVLNGKELKRHSIGRTIRCGMALVPEDRRHEGLVLNMSVKENITLVSLKGLTRGLLINHTRENEVVRNLIESLSIRPGDANRLTKHLSGGNQQKVVLAKWLAGNQPKMFIFDEPTQGIDVGAKAEVHRLIDTLARNGAGILLISSEVQELLNLCDRILVMVRGRIVKSFSRDEATATEILAYAMRKEKAAQHA